MLLRFDPYRLSSSAAAFRPSAMHLDAWRNGERFFVRLDLPGVDPSSIDLTVEKNVLTVSAERGWDRTDGDEVLVAERAHGRFSRQLLLGEGLDTNAIDARYEHGVLTITIPVAEAAKPRKVEVTIGEGSAETKQINAA